MKKLKTKKEKEMIKLKPKAPPGVFFDFCKEERTKNPEKYKNLDLHQGTTILALQWKALPFVLRDEYARKNKEKQAIYKRELSEYEKAVAEGTLREPTKRSPHQPFLQYHQKNYNQVKSESPGLSHPDVMKVLGHQFKLNAQKDQNFSISDSVSGGITG
jgi:hypothetical protein